MSSKRRRFSGELKAEVALEALRGERTLQEIALKKRRTRREVFLEKMDGLIPWGRLEARIEPFYPKAGRGRRPYPLAVMLRVHCVQLFYNLSDPGMEDLLYEVESVRRKASVRAKVEHPFLYVKRHFGYAKVRYRGLAKNTQRIAVLLGFSNLLIAGRYATA